MGVGLLAVGGYSLLKSDSAGQTVFVRPPYETPAPGPGDALRTESPVGEQPYRLAIPAIGVDAPVAPFGMDEEGIPQVPYEGGLVAWYNFSSPPGAGGNAVFAGHYTWYGDAVFRRLGDVSIGDQVVIRGADGAELIYQVSDVLVVEPSMEEAQRWMGGTSVDVVTLITCGGTFTWTGDPVFGGEYDKRQVVRAGLIETRPAPSVAASR